MEPSALRAVPPSDTAKPANRNAPRSRPAKPLPTDRMKFDLQVRILQTFGRIGSEQRPVTPERLSQAINGDVSKYTVHLSHGFFADCGWLQRQGRGEYAATPPLIAYARRVGDPATHEAGKTFLRQAVIHSWFWPVIAPQIEHGPAPTAEVIAVLMDAAEVGEGHRPQVKMLLEWLAYLGMIRFNSERVELVLGPTVVTEDGEAQAPQTPPDEPVREDPRTADPAVPQSTTVPAQLQQSGEPVVLAFSFSLNLTATDLAKLRPEQIAATFEAVGKVLAIK